MLTEEQVEAIDEIGTGLIDWCFEKRGQVPWLESDERAAVAALFETMPPGEARYNAVLDIIETRVDNLAAEQLLASL